MLVQQEAHIFAHSQGVKQGTILEDHANIQQFADFWVVRKKAMPHTPFYQNLTLPNVTLFHCLN